MPIAVGTRQVITLDSSRWAVIRPSFDGSWAAEEGFRCPAVGWTVRWGVWAATFVVGVLFWASPARADLVRPGTPLLPAAAASAPDVDARHVAEQAEKKQAFEDRVTRPVRNVVRLLGRGIDLGERDTAHEGGVAVQLRPRGAGAVVRAVVRF